MASITHLHDIYSLTFRIKGLLFPEVVLTIIIFALTIIGYSDTQRVVLYSEDLVSIAIFQAKRNCWM